MKLAIHQPLFLPYVGYWQLMTSVDLFVIYDNAKFVKQTWISRNRLLREGQAAWFTLPLHNAPDSLDIRDREIAADFDRAKMLRQFAGAYRRAPYFNETYPLLERILDSHELNLFRFLLNSINIIAAHLGIETRIVVSSAVVPQVITDNLKGQDKVLAICNHLDADTYINAPGGMSLYDKSAFAANNIDLRFIRPKPLVYPQFARDFVPWLSIADVMIFNGRERTAEIVRDNYEVL
jgi:hypothetical protein